MQLIAAKALDCQRQPACYPKAIHQRIGKLDMLLGKSRIVLPDENAKSREQRLRQQKEIIDERDRLRKLL